MTTDLPHSQVLDAARILDAVRILERGGLVAFPTETVYGLGADASNPRAVAGIFAAKGRPADHPVIVHVAGAADLDRFSTDPSAVARRLIDVLWPGPLTVVVRRSAIVPDAVTGGLDTVGLRSPAHPVAQALLQAFGGGIAAPSANRFGRTSPTTAEDVLADLGDAVDLVLDGGDTTVGVESTIVDCTRAQPVLLRPGGVPVEVLEDVLGEPVLAPGPGATRAPGTLPAHYAPSARVVLATEDDVLAIVEQQSRFNRRVGLLAPRRLHGVPDHIVALPPAGDPEAYARVVYRRLRDADRLGLDVLVVVPPPPVGIGAAVLDRLRRAAAAS